MWGGPVWSGNKGFNHRDLQVQAIIMILISNATNRPSLRLNRYANRPPTTDKPHKVTRRSSSAVSCHAVSKQEPAHGNKVHSKLRDGPAA